MDGRSDKINRYGHVGAFSDALYFGLRAFKQALIDRLAHRDGLVHQAFSDSSMGKTLAEATNDSLDTWTIRNEALIDDALKSWPAGTKPEEREERQLAIRKRLFQINQYLTEVRNQLSQDHGDRRPASRLHSALEQLTWPYFFVAHSGDENAEPSRKVTWLPPTEYLRTSDDIPLVQSLYPSLSFALSESSSSEDTPAAQIGIEDHLDLWLQIGDLPMPDEIGVEGVDDLRLSRKNIGHVQPIEVPRDYQAVYEGNLLESPDRRESRFADCVYANLSTFQIPIARDQSSSSDVDRVSTTPTVEHRGDLVGVLFLCSPIPLDDVFPSIRERSPDIWAGDLFDAWESSKAQTVGLSLKEKYDQFADDFIQNVRFRAELRVEQKAREQMVKAYNGISHSLGNAISTSADERWTLEKWCLEGAKGVIQQDWSPEFFRWRDACEALMEVFNRGIFELEIVENEDLVRERDTVELDPRLLASLTEICRNLRSHSLSDETPVVHIGLVKDGSVVEIRFEDSSKASDFRAIARRLTNPKIDKWSGVNFISHFIGSINLNKNEVRWSFYEKKEKREQLESLKLESKDSGAAKVEAPKWLIEDYQKNDVKTSFEMKMEFTSKIHNSIIR